METGARVRGLAGWTRGRVLGQCVCGHWVAAAKSPGAHTRMKARGGRVPQPQVPPLRIPAKMMPGGARCATLIASQILKIELTRSRQTRKLFLITSFSAVLGCGREFANAAKRDGRSQECAVGG